MTLRRSALTVEFALLGLIRNQPMHGYEIYQQLMQEHGLGAVWRLKQGLLYAVLRRLEDEGYVEATIEPQDTRPPRRLLQVTPKGDATFRRWLQTPVPNGRDIRIEFLAKLYFAQMEGFAAVETLIDRQLAGMAALLARLEKQASRLPDAAVFDRLVLQFRIGQTRAVIAWLELCRAETGQPAHN